MRLVHTITVIAFVCVGIGIISGVVYLLYGFKSPFSENTQTVSDEKSITFLCSDETLIVALFESNNVSLAFSDGRTVSVSWTAPASVFEREGVRYATSDDSLIFWYTEGIALIEQGGTFPHGECAVKER